MGTGELMASVVRPLIAAVGLGKTKIANSPVVPAAIILVGLLLGYVYRDIFSVYAIIFFSLFLSGLLFAHSTKYAQWVLHNLAFLFLALATTELYFEFETTDNRAAFPQAEQHSTERDGLVYRPGTFRGVKTYGFGTGVVYDVHYSIDENGLRTAPDSLKQNGPLAMFFGDSFTFGAGVNDDETLPNAFSILSGMRILNFGVPGYGPHHMLRLLERDIPKKITSSFPRLMIYTAIASHIARAAGRAGWGQDGPLYEIQNGTLHYVGSFRENKIVCDPRPRSVIEKLLQYSRVLRAYNTAGYCSTSDANTLKGDRLRFVEILKAANVIAHQKYDSSLVVILWDVGETGSAREN